jgi:hypothetical protein
MEAMEAMTNEEKELVDLFQKSLGTLLSADETSNPTIIPSVMGNEDYKVKSEIDEEEDLVSEAGKMPMDIGTVRRKLWTYCTT